MKSLPISILQYIAAPLTVSAFIFGHLYAWLYLDESKVTNASPTRIRTVIALSVSVWISYIVQATQFYLDADPSKDGFASIEYHILTSILLWTLLTLCLLDRDSVLWGPYILTWIVAGISEPATMLLDGSMPFRTVLSYSIVRAIMVSLALILALDLFRPVFSKSKPSTEEQQPLLPSDGENTATVYGTNADGDDDDDDDDGLDRNKKANAQMEKRIKEDGYWEFLKSFLYFIPHIWPGKDAWGQACVALSFVIIVADRILNILVPSQVGKITTKLTNGSAFSGVWFDILLWGVFQWLNSYTLLYYIGEQASTYLTNYSYKAISNMCFTHVMDLSMAFHVDKDTGEVIRAIQQASALNNLLGTVTEILPTLFDVVIGIGYLSIYLFDFKLAFIVIFTGIVYTWMGSHFTSWNKEARRQYSMKSRHESRFLHEILGNYRVVTQYDRAKYEGKRWIDILTEVIDTQTTYFRSFFLANAVLYTIVNLGLVAAIFVAVWEITKGQKPVGNLIALLLYWEHVMQPIYSLYNNSRHFIMNLTDAERIVQLLRTKKTVVESEDAKVMEFKGGEVEFDNVSFGYDSGRNILKNISFKVKAGQKVALVSQSGSGKTTMLNLLIRFWDPLEGVVRIDGEDIKNFTLSSLRQNIGLVSQHPILFNDTIMENIRYAKLDATDEEVVAACKSAAIYDQFMKFPKGLQSKVGERGIKISGGELQRVAIAQVVIKSPGIVVLDEATASVDSLTEAQIQSDFSKIFKGHTSFVIAHRLSTVWDADLILVLENGEIIERGTHQELFEKEGLYYRLWQQQIKGLVTKADGNGEGDVKDDNKKDNIIISSRDDQKKPSEN